MIEANDEGGLVAHLQAATEHEKATLARTLHDNLGGLMVAAVMDIVWAEENLAGRENDVRRRLGRVRSALATAIDMKRKIIEELRPSLLDDMGLFAALSWRLKNTCSRLGLKCTETFPRTEPRFEPDASIALFRIAEGALDIIATREAVKSADLRVVLDADTITMRFAHDGMSASTEVAAKCNLHTLASMRHRIGALGGRLDIAPSTSQWSSISVSAPLSRLG